MTPSGELLLAVSITATALALVATGFATWVFFQLRQVRRESAPAQVKTMIADGRQLIGDLDDMVDRLTVLMARDAKRRSRAMARGEEERQPEPQDPVRQEISAPEGMPPAKAQIWRRIRERGGIQAVRAGGES